MNVVIHLGFYKCGSTYLQENVFAKISGINYICSDKIQDIRVVKDKLNVISHEHFSVTVPQLYDDLKRDNVLYNLKKILGNAKVLIVKRDKESFCKSAYNQYIKGRGGVLSYKSYYYKYCLNIDLDKCIALVKKYFDNVLVIDLNDLSNSHEIILDFLGVESICYDKTKRNVGLSSLKLFLVRLFFNRFKLHPLFKYLYNKIN